MLSAVVLLAPTVAVALAWGLAVLAGRYARVGVDLPRFASLILWSTGVLAVALGSAMALGVLANRRCTTELCGAAWDITVSVGLAAGVLIACTLGIGAVVLWFFRKRRRES